MSIGIWILYFIIALIIVELTNFLLRKKQSKKVLIISSIIKIVLSIIFAVLVMAGPIILRPVQPLLVALYVVLLFDGINDIIFIFISNKKTSYRLISSALLSIIFMSFGTINMQTIKENTHTFYSDKLSKDYSFAFISDIHVGSSQNFDTISKTINHIKDLDIDFLVLGGDITDDYTSNSDMKQFYLLFKDFSYPVYYIYGNHDKQLNASYANGRTYGIEELKETIEGNGITILEDGFTFIDNILIFGRADMSNEARSGNSIGGLTGNEYLIIFDHQPFDNEGILNMNPDLQVSGHTHAGQFFPLNLFYNIVIGPSYGEYVIGNTNLVVSSGASGWRVPFRSDHSCEYELIHLRSNN